MPTNLYGKGDNYHTSNLLYKLALLDRFHKHKFEPLISNSGDGNSPGEFMHVDDLADASLALENWFPNKNDPPLDHLFSLKLD